MSSNKHKCITLHFAGGCELLFDNKPELRLGEVVPVGSTLNDLIYILTQSYITKRADLFVDASGTTIRPGILIIVNGCDAEIMNGVDYIISEGDDIEFVSTLHGG